MRVTMSLSRILSLALLPLNSTYSAPFYDGLTTLSVEDRMSARAGKGTLYRATGKGTVTVTVKNIWFSSSGSKVEKQIDPYVCHTQCTVLTQESQSEQLCTEGQARREKSSRPTLNLSSYQRVPALIEVPRLLIGLLRKRSHTPLPNLVQDLCLEN